MHISRFFKLFPPPKFLTMRRAGLDISDDAIHCLEYSITLKGFVISKFASAVIPDGLIDGGDFKDEGKFKEILTNFDKKNNLSYVKISLPEEKVYLFQTDLPSPETKDIVQNVEFKLEENVPLSLPDAVFYFDILPMSVTGGTLRASVSVVPRTYIERYLSIIRGAGMFPMAFEVVSKSLARAIIPEGVDDTHLIVHLMARKIGLYVVSGGVVCFTSTISQNKDVPSLAKEIVRVCSYWSSHGQGHFSIKKILLVGHDAPVCKDGLQRAMTEVSSPVEVAQIWSNIFGPGKYVPPISLVDSLDFAAAAGLAMITN